MKLSKKTITSPLVNGTIRKEIKFAWFPTTVIENEVEYTVWLEKYIQHYITKPFVMRYLPTHFGGINLDVPMEYLEEMEDGRSLYKKSNNTLPDFKYTPPIPNVPLIKSKPLTEGRTKTNVKDVYTQDISLTAPPPPGKPTPPPTKMLREGENPNKIK